jgi:hypothetical protein
MRIGTWDIAGRWSDDHLAFVRDLDCDVLLLTEVSQRTALPGYELHPTKTEMVSKRWWAAVASRAGLAGLPDPHVASALATVNGWTCCSSVLPWRGCGPDPWGPGNHAARTARALDELAPALPTTALVWGGDWNHALTGREYAGGRAGRSSLLAAVDELGLTVATTHQPHAIETLLSIDHIAVPAGVEVADVRRVSAAVDGRRLSDHDAYVLRIVDHR